jgi:D-arabinose 1-dehydrogenase-like Zn-dependent alcohol dehydrogenase
LRKVAIMEWGGAIGEVDVPTPAPVGAEVLVKVEACGVCHSDVHIWDGFFDLGEGRKWEMEGRVSLPFSPGHEIVGTVEALGPEARGVKVGESYVVYPWIGCGACARCVSGEELSCDNPRSIGVRRDGGYADHVIVPDARYLVAYDGLPKELACTYACSGITAYSALKKVPPLEPADWLAIIGVGGVGLAGVQLAESVVGSRVIAADIDPAKRAHALKAGAEKAVDNGGEKAVKEILRETDGGAAAAIDFVGSPETVKYAIDCVRRGGHVVVVGLFGGAMTLSTMIFPNKLLTVTGSYVGTLDDLREVIALAQQGKLSPIPITPVPAVKAGDALRDLKTGGKVVGRVVLVHG